jgi:hypothetical protein
LAAFTTTMQAGGTRERLLWLFAAALILLAGLQVWAMLRFEPVGMDFLPLWTAGRMSWTQPDKVYDFARVTAAQAWLPQPHFTWPRPYAYPPTTLLLMAPLGRLPFWAATTAWTVLSVGAFLYACARLAGRRFAAVLAAALPAVVIAATAGQTVVLASALIVLGVLELERRPRVAGVLFAIAAIVKPQALIMAPVALLASGALEALLTGGAVMVAAIMTSTILFGPGRWSDWLASLPAFQHVIESIPGLGSVMISPFWVARELGLADVGAVAVAAVFALASAWFTWTVFRSPADTVRRAGALAVGGLLAAPYALDFDATLIAPAAAGLAVAAFTRGRVLMAPLALAAALAVTFSNLGLPALLAFAALVMVARPAQPPLEPERQTNRAEASLSPIPRQRLPAGTA